jgi:tRNA threonylcarbamoyladenosine biosynthesis protein TsaE
LILYVFTPPVNWPSGLLYQRIFIPIFDQQKKSKLKEIIILSEEGLAAAAQEILDAFPEERIFAVSGELGAGKTTFIKVFCDLLGVRDTVTSPSFSIINVYLGGQGGMVYHFDFYRIRKLQEVLDIGYEEYIYSGDYCFLEWAEKIEELLPESYVYIAMQKEGEEEGRLIKYRLAGA